MRMMMATGLMIVAAAATAAVVIAQAPAPVPAAGPQVGDPAPAFSLPGSDGATYTLAEYKGKRAVVLAWYPKAFTGG